MVVDPGGCSGGDGGAGEALWEEVGGGGLGGGGEDGDYGEGCCEGE